MTADNFGERMRKIYTGQSEEETQREVWPPRKCDDPQLQLRQQLARQLANPQVQAGQPKPTILPKRQSNRSRRKKRRR